MVKESTYHSNALLCAERVTLPLRNHTWRGQSGDFLGRGAGSSMDFQDHRNYVPGDDPRHINWQAYARSGTYIMKQYREEVRPTIDVVLDVSFSMFFDELKKQRCSELLYLVHAIALKNGVDIFYHLLAGDTYTPLSPDAVSSQQWVNRIAAVEEESQRASPNLSSISFKQGSIRILISDLLFEGDPTPFVHTLVAREGKPIIIAPFLEEEANPDWSGNYDFIDAELGSKHAHKIDSHTLKQYIKQYTNHFTIWSSALQKHHIPFARISSNKSLYESLLQEALPNRVFEMIQT